MSLQSAIAELNDQVFDEGLAYQEYSRLAIELDSLGFHKASEGLQEIASDEQQHKGKLESIIRGIETVAETAAELYGEEHKPSSVYVTVTDPGNTTFNINEVISSEAFDKENERVRALGEKPALGEYHY